MNMPDLPQCVHDLAEEIIRLLYPTYDEAIPGVRRAVEDYRDSIAVLLYGKIQSRRLCIPPELAGEPGKAKAPPASYPTVQEEEALRKQGAPAEAPPPCELLTAWLCRNDECNEPPKRYWPMPLGSRCGCGAELVLCKEKRPRHTDAQLEALVEKLKEA